VAAVEIPAPDPSKLLQAWMEWERGDVTPGRVMANLKTGGLRQLLEGLGRAGGSAGTEPPAAPSAGAVANPAAVANPGAVAKPAAVANPAAVPGPGAGENGPGGSPGAGPAEPSDGQPASWVPVV
jgi:hypothetical protein